MKKIKLIIFDVDGVLTDGKLHISSDGSETKSFHTQDGMGISLARYAGIKTAIITGRTSASVTKRAEELHIDYLYQGISNKVEAFDEILLDSGIQPDEVCYIGDDINDLPILRKVGFPCAPFNAVPYVKNEAKYISVNKGGNGAVREIIDHILLYNYDYRQLVEEYIYGKVKITQ